MLFTDFPAIGNLVQRWASGRKGSLLEGELRGPSGRSGRVRSWRTGVRHGGLGLVWNLFSLASLSLGQAVANPAEEKLAQAAYAILNRACFECHGRDRQDGNLRLDSREHLLSGGDSGPVIDSAAVAASELLRRIRLPKGDEEVMPKRGDVLNKQEVETLTQWLAAGAPWSDSAAQQKHWSYVAPRKAPLPVGEGHAYRHPVDAFVAARLSQDGAGLREAADARVLCRRLYLDAIGLPPKVEEVEAFVAAAEVDREQAVAALVDKLLSMPQYGEKWARPWLDAARYADSHGFQRDDLHELWAYRDWVIQAIGEDMPFDRFTIEQLAGDLIPAATEAQRIATGFNRCAPCNVEAGTDPEENRFNQIVDRINTFGYVWLGTSLECAQCHDHKYDPFTQQDYYSLFAFFNQTAIEAERANPKTPGSIKFIGPYMPLSAKESVPQEMLGQLEKARARLAQAEKRLRGSQTRQPASATHRQPLRPVAFDSLEGAGYDILEDHSVLLSEDPPETDTYEMIVAIDGLQPVGLLLEALTDPELPGTGPGRGDAKRPNFVLNSLEVRAIDASGKVHPERLQLDEAVADFSQANFQVEKAIDDDEATAWAIGPQFFRPHWAAFRFAEPRALAGVGRLQVRLVQKFGGARTIGRVKLSALLGDYQRALPATAEPVDPQLVKLQQVVAKLEKQVESPQELKTLVMQEIEEPRMSTMYQRGDYRNPGEAIEPGTPTILHAYREAGPRNRLGLAQWLVSKENPLLARVTVNRLWAEIFGTGLVSTPEDFGLKGEAPSHPELLDWLAVDFMDQGWSMKSVVRTILTSHTYRQASTIDPSALEKDPHNTWLGRGPRFRLPAESIRDNALAIAGLLSLKQFGPPIRPPQPEGLWTKVGGEKYDYQVSPGEDQYRRGVYVVLKRMSPYPSFINFDATARLACRVKRGRSNTPLQALTLLNDPVYVEAAQALATRIQNEQPSKDLPTQLGYAFQLAVARLPKQAELQALIQLFEAEKRAAAGDAPASAEGQAWYAVASTLLNLDETITKE